MKKKSNKKMSAELNATNIFLDREMSMLAFNRRVLAQAENKNIPILERLRFLCIVSSNLDEFFEVRIASLMARSLDDPTSDPSVLLASLHRVNIECHQLVDEQYSILNTEVLPRLAARGFRLLHHKDRDEAQRAWVKAFFESQIRPILTPIVLDPAHPFPQIANKSLNFIISLSGKDAFGRGSAIAIVRAPRILPRVIRLPDGLSPHGASFCLLSSVIQAHIADLFPQREVIAYSQFRVTRDSDLWVDEEEVKNLQQAWSKFVTTQLPCGIFLFPVGLFVLAFSARFLPVLSWRSGLLPCCFPRLAGFRVIERLTLPVPATHSSCNAIRD